MVGVRTGSTFPPFQIIMPAARAVSAGAPAMAAFGHVIVGTSKKETSEHGWPRIVVAVVDIVAVVIVRVHADITVIVIGGGFRHDDVVPVDRARVTVAPRTVAMRFINR